MGAVRGVLAELRAMGPSSDRSLSRNDAIPNSSSAPAPLLTFNNDTPISHIQACASSTLCSSNTPPLLIYHTDPKCPIAGSADPLRASARNRPKMAYNDEKAGREMHDVWT